MGDDPDTLPLVVVQVGLFGGDSAPAKRRRPVLVEIDAEGLPSRRSGLSPVGGDPPRVPQLPGSAIENAPVWTPVTSVSTHPQVGRQLDGQTVGSDPQLARARVSAA